MNALTNHLWQSTVFAAVLALAAFALRRNSPRLRYWLWLGASVKFLVPWSLFVSMGAGSVASARAGVLPALAVVRVSAYFAPAPTYPLPPAVGNASRGFVWPLALIWFVGSLLLLIRWLVRWHTIHNAARSARPLPQSTDQPLPVLCCSLPMEPGVFGLFRPVLLLPAEILKKLTPEQFEAILNHELCHLRYRDNLTAALHMCVEILFWFHPLVWFIGAKLIEERERHCDESVLKMGSGAEDYAQGILAVCTACVESPLPCAAGITGASLKTRIREIMTWRGSLPLTMIRKTMLVLVAVSAITIPLVIGRLRAQTLPPPPAYTYAVVSIHPSKPGQQGSRIGHGTAGGLRTENTTVMQLLTFAFKVHDYQIAGAPGWVKSERFDVNLTPDKTEITPGPGTPVKELQEFIGRNQQRMQAVLRDRFGLVLRAETHELPIYALVVAKGGIKLTPSPNPKLGPSLQGRPGELTVVGEPLAMLADNLGFVLGHPVKDETGLTALYDFKLEYAPEMPAQPGPEDAPVASDRPSIFTALTEQLGLRLEPRKGPVPVYVVEKIEKPGEN